MMLTAQQLLRTVALGVSIAALQLTPAWAAPTSKPTKPAASSRVSAADAEAARERIRQHLAVNAVIADPMRHSQDLNLLQDHHLNASVKDGHLEIATKAGLSIGLDRQRALVAFEKGGEPRAATPGDLRKVGIVSAEDFAGLVERRVFATAGGKTRGMTIDVAREKVSEQIQAGRDLVHAVNSHGAVVRLNHFVDTVVVPLARSSAIKLGSTGLEFDVSSRHLVLRDESGTRPPEARDLVKAGLKRIDQIEALVNNAIIRELGGGEVPTGARAAEAVQRRIDKRVQEYAELGQLLVNVEQNADVALYFTAVRSIAPAQPPTIELATRRGERLIAQSGTRYQGRLLVESTDGAVSYATLPDLLRFGITSPRVFANAAAKALTTIAPEDLD